MVRVESEPAPGGFECAVEIEDGGMLSRHTVRVSAADMARWSRAAQGETPEQLVTRAFEFLLARESAGQILRSFDLADITRYFPEFDREMRS